MAKRTKYGEQTTMVSFRVPITMVVDFRKTVYAILDKMSYEKSLCLISFSQTTPESYDGEKAKALLVDEVGQFAKPTVPKIIKEPTRTSDIPFTAKKIMVVGYACLKDEFSETVYWKDTPQTALVFDNEAHCKEWLTKNKT
jgi:hypothetical protein